MSFAQNFAQTRLGKAVLTMLGLQALGAQRRIRDLADEAIRLRIDEEDRRLDAALSPVRLNGAGAKQDGDTHPGE